MQLALMPRRRFPGMQLVGVLVALAAVLAFSAPAHAATVLNRFQRSCNFGMCSAFVQTNPPYQPSIGSDCVTKSYTGQSGEYYRPPGVPC